MYLIIVWEWTHDSFLQVLCTDCTPGKGLRIFRKKSTYWSMPFLSCWKILGPHIAPRRKRSWNEISIYASLLKVILSIIENYSRLRVFIQKRYTFAPLVDFVSTRVLETRIWTNESTRVHTHTHTGARTRPTASRKSHFLILLLRSLISAKINCN